MTARFFIGRHVDVIREILIASAVSRLHVCIVGHPGCGKTAMATATAKIMAPDGGHVLTRLDPSTPVEEVVGFHDIAKLLDPEDQQAVRITEGTPYGDGVHIWIPDELGRASDPMFDKLMQVFDMSYVRENGDYPVCWGTTNFLATGERVQALHDRIALWPRIRPGRLDTAKVIEVNLATGGKPEMPGDIPEWSVIEEVRDYPITASGAKATTAVLIALEAAAAKANRAPNQRRMAQWSQLIYRYSAYCVGSPDFTVVPPNVRRLLAVAYPAETDEEADDWAQIVGSIVDPIGAAIDRILSKVYQQFYEIAVITNDQERGSEIGKVGRFMADNQKSLLALSSTDARISAAAQTITNWFGAAASGEKETISYERVSTD